MMPPPIPGPRTRSWSFGRSAPRELPYSGQVSVRRGVAGSRIRTPALPPFGRALRSPAALQEMTNDGCLPRLLEQEAVVAVGRVDHVQLDGLPEPAKRGLDVLRSRRRVQP